MTRAPGRSLLLALAAFFGSGGATLLVVGESRHDARGIVIGGLLVAALLAALVWSLASTRSRALSTAREMTARLRRDVAERAVLYETATVLSQALSADDALPRVLQAVVGATGWDFGACWTVDRLRHVLRPVATWTIGPGLEGYEAATRARTLGRGVGLPGRVWAAGAAMQVSGLDEIEILERAPAARAAGLHAAFACPIALGGDVLGVLELASRGREGLEGAVVDMFETIGSHTAQFLERDAAEQARRTSEAQTQAVVENLLEGLLVVDEQGTILSANPAAEQMFGYASWELVGQHMSLLLPRSVRDPETFLREAFARSIGRVTEWEGRRKTGDLLRFELSFFELWTPEGRRFAGSLRDISDRRKLEKMKKEFVATVSHELRTPLTSIRGSLSLLAGGALGDLPDEATDVVRIAERNTLRLIDLINDILDLERLEAGKLELDVRATPLSSIVERSLEAVRGLADQGGDAGGRANGGGGARRRRPHRAGAREPLVERHQVLAPRRRGHGGGGARRERLRGGPRGRPRARDPGVAPRAALPALPAGRGLRRAEAGRHRARPRHLEGDRRAARRHDRRGERGREGERLPLPSPRRGQRARPLPRLPRGHVRRRPRRPARGRRPGAAGGDRAPAPPEGAAGEGGGDRPRGDPVRAGVPPAPAGARRRPARRRRLRGGERAPRAGPDARASAARLH
jgi:PAS domain S-box-containing protein